MDRYAQLIDNVVHLVIESETDPDGINGEWVACGNAGPGWLYDGSTFTAPPPAPPVRTLTHLQYMNRFTDAELEAIYTAAKTVVRVEVWLAKFNAAGPVDLDDPQTGKGLRDLEAANLLAPGRAAEILS